jgi:hypothetical protein
MKFLVGVGLGELDHGLRPVLDEGTLEGGSVEHRREDALAEFKRGEPEVDVGSGSGGVECALKAGGQIGCDLGRRPAEAPGEAEAGQGVVPHRVVRRLGEETVDDVDRGRFLALRKQGRDRGGNPGLEWVVRNHRWCGLQRGCAARIGGVRVYPDDPEALGFGWFLYQG